ncbi:hypothetical protein ACSSV6_004032 [Roseovarius sp. MBR-38]|jgi:hypothetical protein
MRPRFSNFRKTLKEWCLLIDGKEPSTNKTYNAKPNYDAETIDWWYEADRTHDGDTPRDQAYLVAYLEVFGPVLPMKGLAVHEGWIYPDRAIMRSLHTAGILAVEDKAFALTDAGRSQIAAHIVEDENKFRRVTGSEQKG